MIAGVAGYALGGGCELAMMCDFIIAADNAHFGQPEINLGIIPGFGGTQRLTRLIGKSKAMEMCLTGRMMDAEEAERSGLISRIVPLADLQNECRKVARKIAALSRPSTLLAKESVNHAHESTLREGIHFRAPHVSCPVRDRRSKGRYGGLCRETPARMETSLKLQLQGRFLHQSCLFTQTENMLIPITIAGKPGKGQWKGRVTPALRQPGSVMNHTHGAQRFQNM